MALLKVQLNLIPVQSRRAERCREAIASVSAVKQAWSVVRETERHDKALSHNTGVKLVTLGCWKYPPLTCSEACRPMGIHNSVIIPCKTQRSFHVFQLAKDWFPLPLSPQVL